jgi:hypothetical protein
MEFGSVTLKRIGFFFFQLNTQHTRVAWLGKTVRPDAGFPTHQVSSRLGHYGPRKVGKWALVAVFARFRADFATKPFSILDGSPILFVTTIPTSEAHRKLRFAFFLGFFFSQRTLFVH